MATLPPTTLLAHFENEQSCTVAKLELKMRMQPPATGMFCAATVEDLAMKMTV